MSAESQSLDQKSLRYALGKHEDADGLACDCVGFANAAGGTILLGIEDDLKLWVGRLKELGVVNTRGKTKATEYFVEPEVLRTLEFQGETTLKGAERHRLRELILRDLEIYRKASISEIHGRVGKEIPGRKIRRELTDLVKAGGIGKDGNTRAAVYLWTK